LTDGCEVSGGTFEVCLNEAENVEEVEAAKVAKKEKGGSE